MSRGSWAPEQTAAQAACRIKPSTLRECGHGLSVARMVGADTCDAADRYIDDLKSEIEGLKIVVANYDAVNSPVVAALRVKGATMRREIGTTPNGRAWLEGYEEEEAAHAARRKADS